MTKYLSLLAAACMSCAVWVGFAQQSAPTIKRVPIEPTSGNSGPAMYQNYCAACHGAGGKGDGPAAPALKVAPTDLTKLTANNKGTFPEAHVFGVLHSGLDIPAHGSSEMPIWNDLLLTLSTSTDRDAQTHLRLHNLVEYLRQIQK